MVIYATETNVGAEKINLGLVLGDSPCFKILRSTDHFSILVWRADLEKKSHLHNYLVYSIYVRRKEYRTVSTKYDSYLA